MRGSWKNIYFGLILFSFRSSSLTCSWLLPSTSTPKTPTPTTIDPSRYSSSTTAIIRNRVPIIPTRRPKRLCAVNGDLNNEDDQDDDDDNGSDDSCLPPGRLPGVKRIFLISDATGVMSRSILLKSLAQFDICADEKAPYATKVDRANARANENENGGGNDDDDNEDYTSTAGTCEVRTRYVRREPNRKARINRQIVNSR
jgi:hypothetical protein